VTDRTLYWNLVEQEYDEPFEEVLKGFRQQGASWKLISEVLDVPFDSLRKWVRELGLSDGRRSSNTYIPPGLNEKAKTFGYRNVEQMICDLRASGKTRKDIAELLNCHPDSLYRFTNEEAKEIVNITPSMVAARRKTVKIAHAAYIAKKKGR
jgi:hypothetical protein